MAHFAKIGINNIVLEVLVVNNADTMTSQGEEQEEIGIEFLQKLTGHANWKQTSYNGNRRKNYAGIGYTYREDIDAFVPPQPYASWVLNANAQWEAPTPMPTDGTMESPYTWDEATTSWIRSPS